MHHVPFGNAGATVSAWFEHLGAQTELVSARDLYSGRAFAEALRASQLAQADLLIASAGLGLVRADRPIPPYSATMVTGADDSVVDRLSITAKDWWALLRDCSPYDIRVGLPSDGLILVAAPQKYLELLEGDLLAAGPERIRIFSRSRPEFLHSALRPSLMPYDARFDSIDSPMPGTISDFAQRALRHFVEDTLPRNPEGTRADHSEMTGRFLETLSVPNRRRNRRASDSELREIIEEHVTARRSTTRSSKSRPRIAQACSRRSLVIGTAASSSSLESS